MKKMTGFISMMALVLMLSACESNANAGVQLGPADSTYQTVAATTGSTESAEMTETTKATELATMQVQIGDSTFTATLEDNPAVDSLVQMMESAPVVIQMSDYAGFEKVGSLGTSLPASNSQITTQPGDIVLYNGNQIVIFYGSNSWSYTRLGKIDDLTGWREALGSGGVTVTFFLESPKTLE